MREYSDYFRILVIHLLFRSKFLVAHRGTINSGSDSLGELRRYTSTITLLIKWVNREIYMGGDNGGDLWKYFVAYEFLLQNRDAVGSFRSDSNFN